MATLPAQGQPRNPFDILPAKLFNVFSTQGIASLQRHYMTILLRLFALTEFTRHRLDRETAIAEIADCLKLEHAEMDVAAQMESEGMARDGGAGERGDGKRRAGDGNGNGDKKPAASRLKAMDAASSTLNDYASYILRRLVESGWIEREQHTDYSETITFPDYAFTLLEALRVIQEQKPRELKGQLYTAHQLITSSGKKDFSPALAITQAYENVRQVARGLSELNQNIRRYIERATRGRDVPDLLRMQFDDYGQTLGPAYHALKTSDHISRYRRAIVDQLQRWQRNAEWLDAAANELAAQRRLTPAQASEELNRDISFILQQLDVLDPVIEEIDRRHTQYLKTSLRQIRYQTVGANANFKDRLVWLARALTEATDQPTGHPARSEIEAAASTMLLTQPIRLGDANSFYTPPQRRAIFAPTLVESPALLLTDLVSLRQATLHEVTQALTPDKISRLITQLMKGERTLQAHELPADVRDDLHTFTAIIAFSHHPQVQYGIEVVDGEPVPAGDFLVQPFQLTLN